MSSQMKANMMRIISLVLVLLMALTVFAACKKDGATGDKTSVPAATETDAAIDEAIQNLEEQLQENITLEATDEDPFTVAASDVVLMVIDEETQERILEIAEKTKLEDVVTVVAAKEGYTLKVVDADGAEITDMAKAVADGMAIQFFGEEEDALVTLKIKVKSAAEIEQVIQQQEQIDKENEEIQKEIDKKKEEQEKNPDTSKTTTPSKDESKTPSKDEDSKVPSKVEDTKKIDIVFTSIWGTNYAASDAAGKAWQETLTNMKNKQGINTTINTIDANAATDTIVKEVMANKSSADVFEVSQVMCRNIAKKGAAANIYDSKTITKSLFQCAATESVTFNGKAYGVTFATKSVNPMGVIYNKDLIKKYAKDYDIVKLYDSKKWNFDNFQEIARACTVDTDGNGKSDIYGFTSNTNVIGMALTSNAGGTALKVNETVEATMCNEAGIKALEWCKEMFKTDKSWLYKADINQCITEFVGGKAAMFVSYLQFYTTIASQASFPLGFVLMPMGPDQSNYRNGVYDGAYFVVPTTKKARLDDIGLWLNGMTGVSNKLLNNNVRNLAMNGFDAKSQEIYKWVVNNMTPEFSSGVFSSAISSEVDSSVTSPAKSPAKVMAAIKLKAQKECDDYYAEIYALK